MEKKIICCCRGGLGNRLRPLSSAHYLAKKLNRKLLVHWLPHRTCGSNIDELFDNDFELIETDDLLKLDSVSLYTSTEAIFWEHTKGGDNILPVLEQKFGCKGHNININDTKDNIVLFHNNFYPNISFADNTAMIKELKPHKILQKSIDEISIRLELNINIIGCHFRTTDFNINEKWYEDKVKSYVEKGDKLFISADVKEPEDYFIREYPNNILRRPEKNYATKFDDTKAWSLNAHFHDDNVKDAVIDMFLLAKTNFKIYNERSTFAQIIKILNG